jgi:glycosyltransferase involved in cell wall biosynthesis
MSGQPDIRILMTTDTVGGVWTYSCALASALAASGADVHLVTMGPRARLDQRTMLRDRRVRLFETELALEWQDPEGYDVANAQRVLSGLEAELGPDLVHLNSFREATFDWRAPTLVVAHSCVNSWGLACHDMDWLSDRKWRLYTEAVAGGLSKTWAWVSPSRAFHDVIEELYQPGSHGSVIWNGIAPQVPGTRKQGFIFAAGRLWDRAKNIAALAEAARGLRWPLLIAGPADGPAPAGATSLGDLPHHALRARLQRAAIFASPALYEPFGLSVLEAAASGCALLLSDIPTFRELWSKAAVFVDPTDAKALNQALENLCADDKKRAELQQAAYERSLDYSLSRMTRAYLRLYEALLALSPPSAASEPIEVQA